VKTRLQSQYKDTIPERVVSMALESVDYSEEKALKILDIVLQEDKDIKKKSDKDKKNVADRNVSFKEPRYEQDNHFHFIHIFYLEKKLKLHHDEKILNHDEIS
jgi:hypothetical protein